MRKKIVFIISLLVMILTTSNVYAESYTLTVENGRISEIGGISQISTITTKDIEEGTEVVIEAIIDDNHYFDHWSSNVDITFDGSINDVFTFTMPSKNITITANEISRSKYETINVKDTTGLDGSYFTNIDDYINFTITYYAPTVGDINSSNQGKFTLPDIVTFEKVAYFDELGNPVTKIEHGKTYIAEVLLKTKELTQFEDEHYYIKSTGSKIADFEATAAMPTFPNNYLLTSVATDYVPNGSTSFSTEVRSGLAYRYMSFIATFEGKYNLEVTFDNNGVGNSIDKQNVIEDETLSKPTDPTAKGYTFVGWYLDKECTKAYDFNTKVTSNITLYAKWTKNTNPKTLDSITIYLIIGTISLIAIGGLLINRKKIS